MAAEQYTQSSTDRVAMKPVFVPERIEFLVGETYAPPPFLWIIKTPGCPPTCAPVNLTGYQATFTAKQSVNSELPPDILATTENGMIEINGPLGSIQLILPSWYTAQMQPFEGFWDLWVYSPPYTSVATPLFGGVIKVALGIGSP